MSEAKILQEVQIAWSKMGRRLWRNNVALAWAGKLLKPKSRMSVSVGPADVVLFNARPIHAGLCEGSSDLIGIKPTVITQEMVGKTVAIFAAVETKSINGRATTEQKNFVDMVNDLGGHGRIAKSVEDSL